MKLKCVVCRKNDDEEAMLLCDGCERPIHKEADCSGLCSSEIRVMELKKNRVLQFFCQDCKMGLRVVPKLHKAIEKLQEEVKEIRSKSQSEVHEEDLLTEAFERQKRMSNIVIHNLPEPRNSNIDATDLTTVTTLLKDIAHTDIKIERVFRMGKGNKNGSRSLKVMLTNPNDVKDVLKNKMVVAKSKDIFISSDLTHLQLKRLARVREEFRMRREKGERDIIIKYVKGIPQITKKPSTNTKN